MTVDGVEQLLRSRLPLLDGLGAIIRFDLGPDGVWIIDARLGAAVLSAGDLAADCIISMGQGDLVRFLGGHLDPVAAYSLGRIAVSGSLNVAMKLVARLR